jgi:hypothetical protein
MIAVQWPSRYHQSRPGQSTDEAASEDRQADLRQSLQRSEIAKIIQQPGPLWIIPARSRCFRGGRVQFLSHIKDDFGLITPGFTSSLN